MKKIVIFILTLLCTMNVSAKTSSIVVDELTGRIFYENNAYEKKLIASTTKIMTAIIVIENIDLNKEVTIGEEILKSYGTNIYVEVGEKIKIIDLLYGLLLRSGNDAALSLANAVSGNEKEFVYLMNKKAKTLGMNNTTFENSHGLDEYTKNYSTAYDMSLLMKYANKNSIFKKISNTKSYRVQTEKKSYLWYNRNKLLNDYKYCTGGKNGYTPSAGKTLITTAEKNNLKLLITTLDDPKIYETHRQLYEQTFKKYKYYTIIDKNKVSTTYANYFREKIFVKENFIYPLTYDEKDEIKIKVIKFNKIGENNIIGYIEIKLKNKIIGKIDIYTEQKKESSSPFKKFINYFDEILKKLKLGLQNNLKPGPLEPIPLDIYKEVLSTL